MINTLFVHYRPRSTKSCQLVDFLFHEKEGDIVMNDVIENVKSMFVPKLTKEEKKVIKTRLKDLSVGEFTK